jgi:hypothetical protein
MNRLPKTKRVKIYHGESEIVLLPELVGMNWVFLKTRTVFRPKD